MSLQFLPGLMDQSLANLCTGPTLPVFLISCVRVRTFGRGEKGGFYHNPGRADTLFWNPPKDGGLKQARVGGAARESGPNSLAAGR